MPMVEDRVPSRNSVWKLETHFHAALTAPRPTAPIKISSLKRRNQKPFFEETGCHRQNAENACMQAISATA